MAFSLPNGVTFAVATAYASSLTVTAATNATETVLTVTNSLTAGDYVEVTSGWNRLNGRIFRLKAATGTTVTLEGIDADTSSTTNFPAGSGTGSIRKINTFTQISQVLECTSTGGEPQYTTFSLLEEDYDRQIPTTTSAQSLSMSIGDDPTLPGYIALKTIARSRAATALKATFPNGSIIMYNGIFALDETPSMTKGNVMAVNAGVALQGRPVRYAS